MHFYTTIWKKTEYMNRKIQNVVKRPKLIMKSDQMQQPKPWTMKIKPYVQARWLLQWNVCVLLLQSTLRKIIMSMPQVGRVYVAMMAW